MRCEPSMCLWAQTEFWLCDELLIVTGSQEPQQRCGFGVAQVQNGPRAQNTNTEHKDCTQKHEDHEAPRTPPASHEAVNKTVQELKISVKTSSSCFLPSSPRRCENINWCCDCFCPAGQQRVLLDYTWCWWPTAGTLMLEHAAHCVITQPAALRLRVRTRERQMFVNS